MPIIDGPKAAIAIRNYLLNEKKIPEKQLPKIIGLTGYDLHVSVETGKKSGMTEVVQKPLSFSGL